ncbi:hypothetical protein DMH03_11500 [Amycolatopsis sp. WAC 01376]|nr:hypothetical protein DMH03_11500 [Amycolatopsis sp. WAC 01376]
MLASWHCCAGGRDGSDGGYFLSYGVELEGVRGAVLVVRTDHARPLNYMGVPSKALLPADVERAIQLALARGWEPSAPGAQFQLDLPAG